MAADFRRSELGTIHIAKAQMGLDDDIYRDILWTICRVRSAADLDSQGRFKLLAHFRSLGWKSVIKKRTAGGPKDRKIWSLWYQLKDAGMIASATAQSLRAEVSKLTGCSDIKFCSEAQKTHVIEVLKQWLARSKNS